LVKIKFNFFSDGHGVLGHEVSGFLRENLPTNLNNQLKLKNKNVLTQNVNSIIEEVFLNLNSKLHSNEIIDTTFSGSTCVSCIYTPEKMITANVGDSRAVVGRCVSGDSK
jgi:serine/threonine protein phosphatase PrpC